MPSANSDHPNLQTTNLHLALPPALLATPPLRVPLLKIALAAAATLPKTPAPPYLVLAPPRNKLLANRSAGGISNKMKVCRILSGSASGNRSSVAFTRAAKAAAQSRFRFSSCSVITSSLTKTFLLCHKNSRSIHLPCASNPTIRLTKMEARFWLSDQKRRIRKQQVLGLFVFTESYSLVVGKLKGCPQLTTTNLSA